MRKKLSPGLLSNPVIFSEGQSLLMIGHGIGSSAGKSQCGYGYGSNIISLPPYRTIVATMRPRGKTLVAH